MLFRLLPSISIARVWKLLTYLLRNTASTPANGPLQKSTPLQLNTALQKGPASSHDEQRELIRGARRYLEDDHEAYVMEVVDQNRAQARLEGAEHDP